MSVVAHVIEDNADDLFALRDSAKELARGIIIEHPQEHNKHDIRCFIERSGKYRHLKRPNVYVVDLCLPGQDGFQVAEYIQQTHPLVPIVMISGADASIQSLAQRYSYDSTTHITLYIIKPVTRDHWAHIMELVSHG